MLIVTLRTDKPEAELGLYKDNQQLAYLSWAAHRQLAETVHLKLKELLESQQKSLDNLDGLAAFKGPGSFTGLRIGLSVANALASSLHIPIVSEGTDDWIAQAIDRLEQGENEQQAIPAYGSAPHITLPRK